MSDGELAELMKDFASDHGLVGLEATWKVAPGHWKIILVAHAAWASDSRDGWDVTVRWEEL